MPKKKESLFQPGTLVTPASACRLLAACGVAKADPHIVNQISAELERLLEHILAEAILGARHRRWSTLTTTDIVGACFRAFPFAIPHAQRAFSVSTWLAAHGYAHHAEQALYRMIEWYTRDARDVVATLVAPSAEKRLLGAALEGLRAELHQQSVLGLDLSHEPEEGTLFYTPPREDPLENPRAHLTPEELEIKDVEDRLRALYVSDPDHPDLRGDPLLRDLYATEYDDVRVPPLRGRLWSNRPSDRFQLFGDRWWPKSTKWVERAEFERNWAALTQRLFEGVDMTHLLVAGGAVLGCLMPNFLRDGHIGNNGFHATDIDVFVHGLAPEQATQRAAQFLAAVARNAAREHGLPSEEANGDALVSPYSVTLLGHYPVRHVQVILRCYRSPGEVLMGFDIDSCCVGYDGAHVWGIPRSIRALASRTNIVDMSRRSPTYEARLIKYARRGFGVFVPGLTSKQIDGDRLANRHPDSAKGLTRLLIAAKAPRLPGCSTEGYYARIAAIQGGERPVTLAPQRRPGRGFIRSPSESDYSFVPAWGTFTRESLAHLYTVGRTAFAMQDGSKVHLQPLASLLADLTSGAQSIEWITENPGRQALLTGSFHPLADNAWADREAWTRGYPVRPSGHEVPVGDEIDEDVDEDEAEEAEEATPGTQRKPYRYAFRNTFEGVFRRVSLMHGYRAVRALAAWTAHAGRLQWGTDICSRIVSCLHRPRDLAAVADLLRPYAPCAALDTETQVPPPPPCEPSLRPAASLFPESYAATLIARLFPAARTRPELSPSSEQLFRGVLTWFTARLLHTCLECACERVLAFQRNRLTSVQSYLSLRTVEIALRRLAAPLANPAGPNVLLKELVKRGLYAAEKWYHTDAYQTVKPQDMYTLLQRESKLVLSPAKLRAALDAVARDYRMDQHTSHWVRCLRADLISSVALTAAVEAMAGEILSRTAAQAKAAARRELCPDDVVRGLTASRELVAFFPGEVVLSFALRTRVDDSASTTGDNALDSVLHSAANAVDADLGEIGDLTALRAPLERLMGDTAKVTLRAAAQLAPGKQIGASDVLAALASRTLPGFARPQASAQAAVLEEQLATPPGPALAFFINADLEDDKASAAVPCLGMPATFNPRPARNPLAGFLADITVPRTFLWPAASAALAQGAHMARGPAGAEFKRRCEDRSEPVAHLTGDAWELVQTAAIQSLAHVLSVARHISLQTAARPPSASRVPVSAAHILAAHAALLGECGGGGGFPEVSPRGVEFVTPICASRRPTRSTRGHPMAAPVAPVTDTDWDADLAARMEDPDALFEPREPSEFPPSNETKRTIMARTTAREVCSDLGRGESGTRTCEVGAKIRVSRDREDFDWGARPPPGHRVRDPYAFVDPHSFLLPRARLLRACLAALERLVSAVVPLAPPREDRPHRDKTRGSLDPLPRRYMLQKGALPALQTILEAATIRWIRTAQRLAVFTTGTGGDGDTGPDTQRPLGVREMQLAWDALQHQCTATW